MNNLVKAYKNIKANINLTLELNPDHFKTESMHDYVRKLLSAWGINDEKSVNWVQNEIDDSMEEAEEPQVISTHKPGWVKESMDSGNYDDSLWERYSDHLIDNNRSFNVRSLNNITDKILDYVHDPRDPGEWSRRGMVVGHVQSGKTSNYIGLINKAIGHGYKLVIVLTGMYDDLRVQTQERIDYGVIGKLSANTREKKRGDKVGVGNSDYRPIATIQSLTTIKPSKEKDGGDFRINNAANILEGKGHRIVSVMAIKKNKSILEQVIKWLQSYSKEDLHSMPVLIVDDEADSASVNSGKIGEDPKTINKLIRIILNLLDKVSFVGYTATPYANIFIDNRDNEKKTVYDDTEFDITKDLFPEDFIINLSLNPLYFGPHRIFGNGDVLPLSKKLEDFKDGYRNIFPASIKTVTELPYELPRSLKEAVIHFLLAAIIREKRDMHKSHNSMLVHVSLRVLWIDKVAYLIDKFMDDCKKKIVCNSSEFKQMVRSVFEDIKKIALKIDRTEKGLSFDLDPLDDFEEIWKQLKRSIDYTDVVAVHGGLKGLQLHENTQFEYGDNARYYIMVGGNRLSRGITLEGLTTSYFVRVSKMYDSLMQMGRWFGYRGNYLDLCRLYTSKDLIKWYGFITQATEKLREEFDQFNYKITPKNYSLKIQKSPDQLKITSLGRMRNSKVLRFSFNGKVAVTPIFEDSPEVHEKNLGKLFANLEGFNMEAEEVPSTKPRIYWKDVSIDKVQKLLNDFDVHEDLFENHKLLRSYIDNNKEIYNNFNVVLYNFKSGSENRSKTLELKKSSVEVYGVQRKPQPNYTESFKIYKDSLTTGEDKYFDLSVTYGVGKVKEAEKLRAKINTPLLLLYLIDGKISLDREEGNRSFNLSRGALIPAYYIVFPKIDQSSLKDVDYVANLIDDSLEYQISDEDEI